MVPPRGPTSGPRGYGYPARKLSSGRLGGACREAWRTIGPTVPPFRPAPSPPRVGESPKSPRPAPRSPAARAPSPCASAPAAARAQQPGKAREISEEGEAGSAVSPMSQAWAAMRGQTISPGPELDTIGGHTAAAAGSTRAAVTNRARKACGSRRVRVMKVIICILAFRQNPRLPGEALMGENRGWGSGYSWDLQDRSGTPATNKPPAAS